MTTIITTIPTAALKACLRVAAKEDVRYYLNGVCYEPREGTLIATDGHILFAVRFTTETRPGQPVIFPRGLVEKALKLARQHKVSELRVDYAEGIGNSVNFAAGNESVTGNLIDGNFPDWRRVVPQTPSHNLAQYNPALLCQLQDAFNDVIQAEASTRTNKSERHPVVIINVSHNGDSGALVTNHQAANVLGVIMPCRNSDNDAAVLDTFGFEKPATPAKAKRKAA